MSDKSENTAPPAPPTGCLIVIAITSGKGGVGKSLISTCMARLLSNNGPVMLIDTDNAAKGSTFLHGSAKKWQGYPISFLGYLNGECEISSIVPVNLNDSGKSHFPYTFIPVETNFSQSRSWPNLSQIKERFEHLVNSLIAASSYNYLVLDCRAGSDELFFILASLSDEIIVICEQDEISLDSALDLRGQLKLERERVNILVNKAPSGYQTTKNPILGSLNFLSPVPYDERLHRKFVEGARELTSKGFKGTSFPKYVGRALKEMLSGTNISAPIPSLVDNVRTSRLWSRTFLIILSLALGALVPVAYLASTIEVRFQQQIEVELMFLEQREALEELNIQLKKLRQKSEPN